MHPILTALGFFGTVTYCEINFTAIAGPNPHEYPIGVSLHAILLLLYRFHGTRIQRQGKGMQDEETVLWSKVTKFFNSHLILCKL